MGRYGGYKGLEWRGGTGWGWEGRAGMGGERDEDRRGSGEEQSRVEWSRIGLSEWVGSCSSQDCRQILEGSRSAAVTGAEPSVSAIGQSAVVPGIANAASGDGAAAAPMAVDARGTDPRVDGTTQLSATAPDQLDPAVVTSTAVAMSRSTSRCGNRVFCHSAWRA